MLQKRKLLALLMTASMTAGIFFSCGTNGGGSTSGQNNGNTTNKSSTVHPVRFVTPGNMPSDAATGIDAVNEQLLADGYDIELQMIRISWDAYDQKLNLMLSSGEEFELLHVMQDVKSLSSLASRDALEPIDDYLGRYPSLVEMYSDTEWAATRYNGKTYAVPCTWRSFDNAIGFLSVRQDIMENFTDTLPDTVDGILTLMQSMQGAIEDKSGLKAYHWPHQLSYAPYWLHRFYDSYPFYVEKSLGIVLSRQDGTIDSYYESEEFKKDCEIYRKLYQDGLISPDILNFTAEQKNDALDLGAWLPSESYGAYSDFTTMENEVSGAKGKIYMPNEDAPDMIYTLCQNLNAISSTAEDPESGLKFLEWLYASKKNHDLYHYGIEGTHYTASSDNRYEPVLDASKNAMYEFDTWMTGYLPWMRYDEIISEEGIAWSQYQSDHKVVSPIAGFMFDSTKVSSQLTSLETEIITSIYPIKYGLVDYEDAIDEAIKKLKSAGLDEYLKEYRSQFEAYLAENPDAVQ